MKYNQNLTQAQLKERLYYDPDTGIFTRKKDTTRYKAGSIPGCPDKHGYITLYVAGKNYLSHRLAFLYMKGRWPINYVGHVNAVKDDNRWENLVESVKHKDIWKVIEKRKARPAKKI